MSDWEEDPEPVAYSEPTQNFGINTGKGRGFSALDDNDDDDHIGFNRRDYSNGDADSERNRRGRGGGRGGSRGGGGRRGGRGGWDSGGYENNRNGNSDDHDNKGVFRRDFRGDDERGGGGGRRGGRGKRDSGGYDNRNGNDDDNKGGYRGDFRGDDDRGGRGGRGRGGGGGSSFRNGEGDENGIKEKPKERYIPKELDSDDELFNQGSKAGENFGKYDSIEVVLTGENKPSPINSFHKAGLRKLILDNVLKSGYDKPLPVQKYAIPAIMSGRDLMACAQTGSGKTAAFLLPIIHRLLIDPIDSVTDGQVCEPQAVIISPTRELATQICYEGRKYAKDSNIKICLAYGGTAVFHQENNIKKGCHILVATTGRLKHFVERGSVSFASMNFFVLDEADRMLDMGFLGDIEFILQHSTSVSNEQRQTLMFSATFPNQIQELASKFMNNYLFLTVGIVGGACSDVEQVFLQISKKDKRQKLCDMLNSDNGDRILVFVEKKRSADFLATFLSEQGFPTTSIHGDRQQREREEALDDFRRGKMRILVATAVANRGLDIKGVSHVIFFDLPKSIEEFVHGIGRTGRVGNSGKATSFYDSEDDSALAGDLIKILKQADQNVPDWLESESSGGGSFRPSNFGGRDFRKFEDSAPASNYGQPVAVEEEEEW